MQDPPITPQEVRDYIWDAIRNLMEANGLIPCAPSYNGSEGRVMDFQRVFPRDVGMPNRFRITIEAHKRA